MWISYPNLFEIWGRKTHKGRDTTSTEILYFYSAYKTSFIETPVTALSGPEYEAGALACHC